MTTNTCIDFTTKLMMKERIGVKTAFHLLQPLIYSQSCLSNYNSISLPFFLSPLSLSLYHSLACSLSGELILQLFNPVSQERSWFMCLCLHMCEYLQQSNSTVTSGIYFPLSDRWLILQGEMKSSPLTFLDLFLTNWLEKSL